MFKSIITTALTISVLTASVVQAADKNLLLAKECRNISAIKQYEPYTLGKSYSYTDNKRYVDDFCEKVHSPLRESNAIVRNNFTCGTHNNLTVTKITLKGKNRFGEEDNRSFSCYFYGRDYKVHTVYKHDSKFANNCSW